VTEQYVGPLEAGQPVPDFELRDQHGQNVSLSSFRGSRAVLLVFYPFAFSRVCTGELRELRDSWPPAGVSEVELLAVSCDPVYSLRSFADSDGLSFPLLSDFWPHGDVSSTYGVFDSERGCSTRSSFAIDRKGVLRWQVHHALPNARDVGDYARVLAGF